MKNLILTIAALFLLSPSLYADQITLKNGDRLTGDTIDGDVRLNHVTVNANR